MGWPWKRHKSNDLLVASWSNQSLAYVRARLRPDGIHEVLQAGVERQGTGNAEEFVRRLQGVGLKGLHAYVMLRPDQYQLLQVEAPVVAPEEVRAAARWQIRELVDLHMDDMTLDVMRVGGGKPGTPGQLFVVVAANTVLADVLRLGTALQWDVPVIDIQETAQRNLQSALLRREGRIERANAALMMVDEHLALLTISAGEELYYSRRIELGGGFMAQPWRRSAAAADDEVAQRLVVELQRSLDVWDRTWSNLPLDGLWVEAGARTDEMAAWLSQELGFAVRSMVPDSLFPGFEKVRPQDRLLCLPLLGSLLRVEDRNL